jgi:hypothetical protein
MFVHRVIRTRKYSYVGTDTEIYRKNWCIFRCKRTRIITVIRWGIQVQMQFNVCLILILLLNKTAPTVEVIFINKHTPWLVVRKGTTPTDDRRLSRKLVPTLAIRGVLRGQLSGSLRYLGFLDQRRYFSFK